MIFICRQYEFSKTEDIEAMKILMEWLPKNIPSQVPFYICTSLCTLYNVHFIAIVQFIFLSIVHIVLYCP